MPKLSVKTYREIAQWIDENIDKEVEIEIGNCLFQYVEIDKIKSFLKSLTKE